MMESGFLRLEELILALCRDSRVHVCVHDVEGALYAPEMRLRPAFRIHSAKFCDLAKDTPRGFSLCMRCKTRANKKALAEGRGFAGYCPYGLYELARPVVVEGTVACILYIGNLVPDEKAALSRLRATAAVTGADADALSAELGRGQPAAEEWPYERIADALESYIRLMLLRLNWKKQKKPQPGCRRKAREAAEYIDANFNRDLSLRQLAALYFVNEKYLGRVFREEMGESMREYLNRARLGHAARLLENGRETVLNIALDCGFQNISYFNRLFMEAYHMTPLAYRRARRTEDLPGR